MVCLIRLQCPQSSESRATSAGPCWHQRLEDEEGMKEEMKKGDADTIQHKPAQAWGSPDWLGKQSGEQAALHRECWDAQSFPSYWELVSLLFLTTAQAHKPFFSWRLKQKQVIKINLIPDLLGMDTEILF